MLATVDEMTAERVARDVRDFGHGYIRVDREGRAEHIPAVVMRDEDVMRQMCDEIGERRTFE